MTYRLINLLDRLHLETCTCLSGLDVELKTQFLLLLQYLLYLSPRAHTPLQKVEFIKLSAYQRKMLSLSIDFIYTMSAKLRGLEFLTGIRRLPKLRQPVKLALYIWSSPSYLDKCWEIAADTHGVKQKREGGGVGGKVC